MDTPQSPQDNLESPAAQSETMECRRCGVCCTMHQAFVDPEDIVRIISYLGLTMADWQRLYDDSRWQFSEYRLIRHVNGACAFLEYDNNGLAACAIHPVKPACCGNWKPGPERKECREGVKKAAG
jgi:Fe-S-cluster containining protein